MNATERGPAGSHAPAEPQTRCTRAGVGAALRTAETRDFDVIGAASKQVSELSLVDLSSDVARG
ncbi:hypothetical protein JOF36_006387 [Pseudonocardia parietis]|uniref:FXSXX-COOH protein n=1 Tax=Pseudonocardia parietis TaxID=570936 RepID=A0ABS4W3Y1_9PSEU|nr:hypothetical protein [Pseudonocardia parietis]